MKHTSERDLWVNVILRATEDGLADKQEREWFQLTNADFVEVCTLADLDPEAVADRAAAAFSRYDHAEGSGTKFEIIRQPMPAPRPIVRYDHVGYSMTLPEWAEHTGIKLSTIKSRMNSGRSFAEAIDPDFKRKPRTFNGRKGGGRKPKLHTVNGVSKTLSEWCVEHNVSYHSLTQRLKRGQTLEHALTHGQGGKRASLLHTVDGVSKTYGQWADYLGISYDAFLKRLRDGNRTVAEAVAMGGPRPRTTKPNSLTLEVDPQVDAHHADTDGKHLQRLAVASFLDRHDHGVKHECADQQCDNQDTGRASVANAVVRLTTPHLNHSHSPFEGRLAGPSASFNRGVAVNLPEASGTGGGSATRDRAQIEFSENPEKNQP